MKETIRVFVNAGPLDLPSGADVAQAIRLFDPALERQIASGTAYVTDGRGIEIDPTSPLEGGAILRVVVRARRSESGHADT
jgi:hypothetical protein